MCHTTDQYLDPQRLPLSRLMVFFCRVFCIGDWLWGDDGQKDH